MNSLRSLLFASALGVLATTTIAQARQPNVVLILSDDQAWTDYSFLEHEAIQTPHLDRLARESLTFTRGYVPSSLCRPSLMTIITGLYPHQHGVTGNDPPQGVDRGAMLKHVRQTPTLPKWLAEKNYRSFQSGKWWEGNYAEGGFTDGMTHGDPARGGRHGDEGLKIGRQGLKPVFDFIDDCGDEPFFVWYAPMLPHSPHNPPERLLQKYQKEGRSEHVARYYAMCEWWDETCGQLLNYLEQKKLSEHTLVAYVTDNGWIQDPDSRNFAPRSKRSPHEGGIRTPIMIRWPGHITPRRDDVRLVSSIDLAPTLLAACGVNVNEGSLPGENLLRKEKGDATQRETLFGEIFEHDVADLDDPAASLMYRWCIDGWWKLILPKDGRNAELYDLKNDPAEKQNLAKDQPETVVELTKKINQWWPIKPK